jgi:hypothetical protein
MAKQRTITLTAASPIKINEEAWPLIAKGEDYPGQYDFQAFDLAWIKVRRHEDGRTIVYGGAGDASHGGRPERENRRAGYLLTNPTRTVETIRIVVEELAETAYCSGLAEAAGRRCIADLPAEELS